MLDMYDAIDDDVALSRLSESLAQACGARSAAIQCFTPGGAQHLMQMSYFGDEAVRLYSERFFDLDPWRRKAEAVASTGKVYNMDELLPPEEFVHTEMYNELFRPLGDDTARCMGAMASIGSSVLVTAVHRPLRGRAFTQVDQAHLLEAFSHVQRVLRLRQLLDAERTSARLLRAMIEASHSAMVVVDRRLRIILASPAAIELMAERDGLICRAGALELSDSKAADHIRAAVFRAIDRAAAGRSGFACERPSGRLPYRILVLPAGANGDDGALLVIRDPCVDTGGTRLRWVTEAYGFSQAEMMLAKGLLQGLSLAEIAASRTVGSETVRTQLKSLFAKTGTSRQVDLVRLLSG